MKDIKHPGWAVKFANGTWLCSGHGFSTSGAYCASVEETKEQAEWLIKEAISDWDGSEMLRIARTAEVVPAWETLVEHLQAEVKKLTIEVKELKAANRISPKDIRSTVLDLEHLIANLRKTYQVEDNLKELEMKAFLDELDD